MKKYLKQVFIVFLTLGLICLCSCKFEQEEAENGSSKEVSDMEIHEESQYYKIVSEKDNSYLYYCYFYNKNSEKVKVEGPLSKYPKVIVVDDELIRFTVQVGTGIGTQWGYYYDITTGVFSDVFQSVYDQNNNRTVLAEENKVIVRDIFDETRYYREFIIDKEKFSEVAEPIINVKFVNDGKSVMVAYLTGNDYKETTETFELK